MKQHTITRRIKMICPNCGQRAKSVLQLARKGSKDYPKHRCENCFGRTSKTVK